MEGQNNQGIQNNEQDIEQLEEQNQFSQQEQQILQQQSLQQQSLQQQNRQQNQNSKRLFSLRICSFILTMVMLALFSVGTLMAVAPAKSKENNDGVAQLRTSACTLKLNKFDFGQSSVALGDAIDFQVDADVEGDCEIDYYQVNGRNVSNGSTFSATAYESEKNVLHVYNAKEGTYSVNRLIVAMHKGNQNYYASVDTDFCEDGTDCENAKLINKQIVFTPMTADSAPFYEYTILIARNDYQKVSLGDKLEIELNRVDSYDEISLNRRELKSMMLSFTNESDGNVVNAYLKNIRGRKPYIVIPSTATVGKYSLDYGYLTFMDGSEARFQNTPTKTFSYTVRFEVTEAKFDKKNYAFSNDLFSKTIEEDINKLDNDAIIKIDANNNSVIDSKIFKLIQNTKRTLIIDYEASQWVFSGTDIKNPKTIDVSTLVSKLEKSNEYYDEFLKTNVKSPSALLKFSDNGELPGRALIKIESSSIDEFLKDPKSVYVYYYKEDSDKLLKVAMEIQKNDGFYEFYINHNSKYVVASKEIKTKAVSDSTEMLSLNHKIINSSAKTSTFIVYVLATCCGVLAIMLLVVVIAGKKSKKSQKQAS